MKSFVSFWSQAPRGLGGLIHPSRCLGPLCLASCWGTAGTGLAARTENIVGLPLPAGCCRDLSRRQITPETQAKPAEEAASCLKREFEKCPPYDALGAAVAMPVLG